MTRTHVYRLPINRPLINRTKSDPALLKRIRKARVDLCIGEAFEVRAA